MPAYDQIIEISYRCPYCGETIGALLDPDDADNVANGEFEYTEDCTVCCNPIVISGYLNPDAEQSQGPQYSITARREND